jgi:hypothetical protein
MAAKNPSKTVRALAPKPLRVCGLVLHEFTAGTLLLLQRIEHPLVTSKDAADMTNTQVMQVLYALTRPSREALAKLNEGDDAFEEAVLEMADLIPVSQLADVGRAVAKAWSSAWETGLATVPPGEKKTS